MKIVIDRDRCISAGECCYNHPDLFEFGDEGLPVVRVDEVTGDRQRLEVAQAIEVCPTGAISIEPSP